MTVVLTEEAQKEFAALPVTIRARVLGVFERLSRWPETPGAKPLSGKLAGLYRIRTGDWRIIFAVKDDVTVVRIPNRRDAYGA